MREHSSHFLVGERDGKIICTGGIHRFHLNDWSVLCFGLVDPKFQNQGVGTALTLARLSLLDPAIPTHLVFIFALTKSIGFYRRMGFQDAQPWEDKTGQKHPSATLVFNYHEIQRAGKILRKHSITVPSRPERLPFIEFKPEPQ